MSDNSNTENSMEDPSSQSSFSLMILPTSFEQYIVKYGDISRNCVAASLDGNIWKIKVEIGDEITSPEQVVVILEAMKTEINIEAGEENVGLRVVQFGYGVKEGTTVKAGDPLVLFGVNT